MEQFNYYYGGVMLAINTFGYEYLILLTARYFIYQLRHIERHHTEDDATDETKIGTDHAIQEKEDEDDKLDKEVISIYLLYRGLLVCTSVMSTFILRRHLMIWSIFSPKLVFEVSFYIVIVVLLFIGM